MLRYIFNLYSEQSLSHNICVSMQPFTGIFAALTKLLLYI